MYSYDPQNIVGQFPSSWEFGSFISPWWRHVLPLPKASYELQLEEHSGVIVGLSDVGIHLSQMRLAVNAVQHGWKVVLFDAHGSERKAASFVDAMRQVKCGSTYAFQNVNEDYQDIMKAARGRFSHQGRHGNSERSFGRYDNGSRWSPSPPIIELVPDILDLSHGRRDDVPRPNPTRSVIPFRCANAVYLGFNAWDRSQEITDMAHTLLTEFVRYLTASGEHHVLLLIEHPIPLFTTEELCSLYAVLEQQRGSLFVSTRSVADFGQEAHHLLRNARTLIVHRSATTLPFEPYVSLSWQSHHPLFTGMVRRFAHNECFVIHAGQASPVRVTPIPLPDSSPEQPGEGNMGQSPRSSPAQHSIPIPPSLSSKFHGFSRIERDEGVFQNDASSWSDAADEGDGDSVEGEENGENGVDEAENEDEEDEVRELETVLEDLFGPGSHTSLSSEQDALAPGGKERFGPRHRRYRRSRSGVLARFSASSDLINVLRALALLGYDE